MTVPSTRRHLRPRKPTVWVRVLSDAVMASAALLIALGGRFLWVIGVEGLDRTDTNEPLTFSYYLSVYVYSVPIVASLLLAVFYFGEIYGRRRTYPLRAKLWSIGQCATLAYVLFGTMSYLFAGGLTMPRSAFFAAWSLTLILLLGARVWSALWKQMASDELKSQPPRGAHEPVRNILVIGGAGYVGSSLLPKLLEAGYRVRLMDLMLFGFESIHEVADHPRLEIQRADFRAVDQVVEAMQEMDAVIHLGGIVGDPACALDEGLTVEVNLVATRMVAEVAKSLGIRRFLFASTCSVYGASDEVLDESSALNPVSVYAKSKIASERALRNLANVQFRPTILRFGTLYGLSGRMRFDLVVNLLSAKAIQEGEITIYSGDQWRPFLHVEDAARSLVAALQAPIEVVGDTTFNVGGDEQNMTIQDVGEIIQELVPTAKIVQAGQDADRRNYRVSFGAILEAMDFRLKWTVQGGVKQLVDQIRSGALRDYKDPRYSNVKSLGDESASRLVRIDLLAEEPIR